MIPFSTFSIFCGRNRHIMIKIIIVLCVLYNMYCLPIQNQSFCQRDHYFQHFPIPVCFFPISFLMFHFKCSATPSQINSLIDSCTTNKTFGSTDCQRIVGFLHGIGFDTFATLQKRQTLLNPYKVYLFLHFMITFWANSLSFSFLMHLHHRRTLKQFFHSHSIFGNSRAFCRTLLRMI